MDDLRLLPAARITGGRRDSTREPEVKDFLDRWGSTRVGELIARFGQTVPAFPPEGMNDETTVNITAYVLQVNGAKAGTQPLTRSTLESSSVR